MHQKIKGTTIHFHTVLFPEHNAKGMIIIMKSNQPNIVMISCDQLRGDFLGCSGNEIIQTPHIDQLANKGVRFTQAYSTTPICIPSRATIMTGLDGNNLGLTEYREGFELPVEETLPEQLGKAGYQTQVIGKMHVYPERCRYGFDDMKLWEEGRKLGDMYGIDGGYGDYEEWLAEQGYTGMAFGHGMSINGYNMTPWHLPDYLHPTEWIGHETCKEIKRRDWTKPLFMWASFTAPHPPLVPLMKDLSIYRQDKMPVPVKGDWNKDHPIFHEEEKAFGEHLTNKQTDLAYRGYFALVTQVDRQINRIIGTLREEGMLDNTWFIFTSDHGDNMGDHGLWQKSNFLKGSTNIPFIITPPLRKSDEGQDTILNSKWVPGQVNHSVIGLQDILPTCCDIAGAEIPKYINGKSLLSLIQEERQSVRETILGEFGSEGKRSFMLTDGIWKYIWYEEDGAELLFHIEDDPNETRNLININTQVKEEWKRKLIKELSARKDDPAYDGKNLNVHSPGKRLTDREREERVNTYPYFNPKGYHR